MAKVKTLGEYPINTVVLDQVISFDSEGNADVEDPALLEVLRQVPGYEIEASEDEKPQVTETEEEKSLRLQKEADAEEERLRLQKEADEEAERLRLQKEADAEAERIRLEQEATNALSANDTEDDEEDDQLKKLEESLQSGNSNGADVTATIASKTPPPKRTAPTAPKK